MNELQVINNTQISIKEFSGKRVVTFKNIDAVHGRPDGTARKRFNDNREHFITGEDFFVLTQPSEIRTLGIQRPQGGTPESVTLDGSCDEGHAKRTKIFPESICSAAQGPCTCPVIEF